MRVFIELSRKLLSELYRSDMPQISQANLPLALKKFKHQGIDIDLENVSLGEISTTQKDFNRDKVNNICSELTEPFLVAPIIISSDGKIVDGHHRYQAVKERFGSDSYIPAYRLSVPIKDALAKYNEVSADL